MIYQRFYPIRIFLNPILSQCHHADDAYFNQQYDLDSRIVSEMILTSEEKLLDTLKDLSTLTREEEVLQRVRCMKPECRFLLYAVIQISFLHFHASTEQFPLLSPDRTYYFLFSYLQEGFFSFKKLCLEQGLDLWDQILDYEISLMENPS